MNTCSRKIDGRKMNRRKTSSRGLYFSADHFSAGPDFRKQTSPKSLRENKKFTVSNMDDTEGIAGRELAVKQGFPADDTAAVRQFRPSFSTSCKFLCVESLARSLTCSVLLLVSGSVMHGTVMQLRLRYAASNSDESDYTSLQPAQGRDAAT